MKTQYRSATNPICAELRALILKTHPATAEGEAVTVDVSKFTDIVESITVEKRAEDLLDTVNG